MKSDIIDWFSKVPTLTAVLAGIAAILCAILFCCLLVVISPLIGFLLGIAGVGIVVWATIVIVKDICKTRGFVKRVKSRDLLFD